MPEWNYLLSVAALEEAPALGAGLQAAAPLAVLGALAFLVRAALPRSLGRWVTVAREVLLLFPLVLLYFIARGAAHADPAEATVHAEQVIALERTLGIFHERALQLAILQSPAAVEIVNGIYIYGHWPVIAVVFVWLARYHRDHLPRYRYAMILSGAVGVIVFLAYPVAPPRLMPEYDFVDTVFLRSRAYRVLQPTSLTDLFAAVPSLHVGWNLLMGIALVRESSNRAARAFGAVSPLAMAAAVVLTANHYFVDVLAGVALVLVSLAAADRLVARRRAVANGAGELALGPDVP